MSQAGVKVMLCDIEDEALATAVAKLKLTNADVDGVRADVSLKAELQAAADATVARYGRVHILVNNAGVGGGRGYGHWTDAGWNWVLGVNLMSVIWGIEIFGPLIEAHGEGGQIVSTASISGLTMSGGKGDDFASGGGVLSLGAVTLTDCTVSGNSAAFGGGVFGQYATVTLTRCTVSDNTAETQSGVFVFGGTATLYKPAKIRGLKGQKIEGKKIFYQRATGRYWGDYIKSIEQ